VLTCGPWGSGTSAVAGLLARLGAVDFDRSLHFLTSDPFTRDSHEFLPFRETVLRHVDERRVSLRRSPAQALQRELRALAERIERQEFGRYDPDRSAPISLKCPPSALLIPAVCEVFDTRLIYVMRPIEEIERSRLRRQWSPCFGSSGAETIYEAMREGAALVAVPILELRYADLISAPIEAAYLLARFIGLEPTQEVLAGAAAFVSPRGEGRLRADQAP
jgi:hypothetical protein